MCHKGCTHLKIQRDALCADCGSQEHKCQPSPRSQSSLIVPSSTSASVSHLPSGDQNNSIYIQDHWRNKRANTLVKRLQKWERRDSPSGGFPHSLHSLPLECHISASPQLTTSWSLPETVGPREHLLPLPGETPPKGRGSRGRWAVNTCLSLSPSPFCFPPVIPEAGGWGHSSGSTPKSRQSAIP